MPSRKSKIFGALLVLNLLLAAAVFQFRQQATTRELATTIETSIPLLETLPRSSTPKTEAPASEVDQELAQLFDNAIADLGAGETDDARYIAALNGSTHTSGIHADHLNKVDLSALTVKKASTSSHFDEEIQSLVGGLIGEPNQPRHKSKKQANKTTNASLDNYIAQLDKEARIRRNEVRLIKVQPGETLWKIAERAYGDGHLYKKIFKANPHLRNPDMISAGEMLRVPI